VRLRRTVERPEERPTLDPGPAPVGIDADVAHRRQVDHQPALGNGQAENAVAAAFHRDLEAGISAVADRRRNVVGGGTAGDQTRPSIDHRVPDLAMTVVRLMTGFDDLAGEAGDRG
jgi:hypothetical protein